MLQVGKVREVMACRLVYFCNWSGGGTSILADPFVSVVRILVGCHLVTSKILDTLCCLPSVAGLYGL